jgi:putative drug exporter of the RND superfamily
MISLARFSIRRPAVALIAWLIIGAVLAVIGLGVSHSLSPSVTVVPGTQSARAQKLANATFGPTQLVPILLEGPTAQLNRQGPRLVAALARRPHTRVLSAWDAGSASAGLRPTPTAAMIVVSVDRSESNVIRHDEPQIQALVARQLTAPVRSFVTGQASIDRALTDASLSHLRHSELIALAILFVLLLIGLRAPVAALLVTAVGAISTLAGFGEVALLGHVIALDPVGVALGTMTGLALGVGFALLILDRFHREQLAPGAHPPDAATAAIRELQSTGRAVLIAGTGIALSLAIVAVIGPTQLMISLGTGMLVCALFATGGAVVVMPAALVLLGQRIDLLHFPAPGPLVRAWSRLLDGGSWVTRHAVAVGGGATVLLALLAVPAFALHSGAPDVTQLPAGATARIAFEQVSRVMGPGWATPYNVILVAPNRPITTPALLASINRFETQIARDKTVYSVEGPGAINATSGQLKTFGPQLRHSATISDQSKTQLLALIKGLGQAGSGSTQLQSGLAAAASGASQLRSGSGTAQSGAGQLHAGLAQAKAGSQTLAAGLTAALSGARALRTGAGHALTGSSQLLQGIGLAQGPATASLPALKLLSSATAKTSTMLTPAPAQAKAAANAINAALSAIQSIPAAKADSHYQTAVSALQQAQGAATSLSATITTAAGSASSANGLAGTIAYQAPGLVAALNMLHSGAAQLQSGLSQLRAGNAQLATGIGQLSGGGGQLTSGLGQLTAGAGALQTGLGQLTDGTGQLASGLTGGVGPAGQLTAGLGTMQAAVIKARGQIPSTKALKALERQSPGIFSSGYFVLSAVAGAPPAQRTAASFTINLLRGGTAGQIIVVSAYRSSDPRSQTLGTRLDRLGATFAARNNLQLAVGGPAGSLGDLTSVTQSRVGLDIAILAIVMALMLGLATRALLLPAVATLFSLLVAASSFGVLQLLFGGPDPLLGGPGYLDPMSIIGIFTIAFAITISYSALLLMRTREAYLAGTPGENPVQVGLAQTAAAATGAGLVMVAALIPFATTSLLNVRAFGIGVAIAILLDVAIVRPALLPAAIAVLGHRGWLPTQIPATPQPPRHGAGTDEARLPTDPSTPIGASR